MVTKIFDKGAIDAKRRRAAAIGDPSARFLMDYAIEDLADRLAAVQRRFDEAVILDSLTGDAAALLSRMDKAARVEQVESRDEIVPLEVGSRDLIISLFGLAECDDLPGMLMQVRRALRPDGLFLAAMLGGETLRELRQSLLTAEAELTGGASPRVAPFADVRDLGALLQRAGFALPVADIDTLTVRYDDLFGLARDLRAMAATNALMERSRRFTLRSVLLRAAQIYGERHADPDGRIRATFSVLWMSGWAPADTQPKPLRPGSAKVSLKDVLAGPGPTEEPG
jgi:SAM-dependent methyltransferase